MVTWCKQLTHWERSWSWKRLRTGGKGDSRGQDDWMVSLTQWTWVWAAPEDSEGEGSLVCCIPWGPCKESDTTEWLNNNSPLKLTTAIELHKLPNSYLNLLNFFTLRKTTLKEKYKFQSFLQANDIQGTWCLAFKTLSSVLTWTPLAAYPLGKVTYSVSSTVKWR